MVDITCARCSEPWDAYEVFHELEEDERKTFLEGSECPACQSKPASATDYRQA